MNTNRVYKQGHILEAALQASQYKNEVILNNIANADTPNYKRKNVEFKSLLKKFIENNELNDSLGVSKLTSNLVNSSNSASTRLDKNGVDIETEMVEFYKNSTFYDVVINSVLSNSSIKNNVLSTFR